MVLLKATLLFSSVPGSTALSLISPVRLEQSPVESVIESVNESLQILDSIFQLGSPTNATTSPNLKVPLISVHCVERLGIGLLSSSCGDAISHLDIGPVPQTWGMRGTGTFSRPLPRYTISTDGLCIVAPNISPGELSAIGTGLDIGTGAAAVLHNCVENSPGHVGGVARNISGDESLNVFIMKNDPSNVLCHSSMPGSGMESSCLSILESMPFDTSPRWFGAPGAGIDVSLPKTFISQDGRCRMNIRIAAGMRDRMGWDQFYYNGIAVVGMCVRTGQRGGAFNLGPKKKMALLFTPS